MGQGSKFMYAVCIACITTVMGLMLVPSPGYAQELIQNSRPVAGWALESQIRVHDQAALEDADPVDRQLAQYARQVPEMGFVRLYSEQGARFAHKLLTLLGEGAINLDYEHDATMSSSLIELQINRIGTMVREGFPSATLFKVGKESVFEHPYLCVISLDTSPFRQDQNYATRFLTPDFGSTNTLSNGKTLVKNEDLLKFTVDHEVFHCLDAYFNGPAIKRTDDAIYNHYQKYLNEARADAFASEAFKQSSAQPGRFLSTLAALRTLSLLEFDLQHFTGDVILHSITRHPSPPLQNLKEEVSAIRELVAEITPSSNSYGTQMANMARLMEELGINPDKFLNTFKGQKLPPHDESKVLTMLHEVRLAKSVLEIPSIFR